MESLGFICAKTCLWYHITYSDHLKETFTDDWDPQSLYKSLFLNYQLQVRGTTSEYLVYIFMSCLLSFSKYEIWLSYIPSLLKVRSSFKRSLPCHYSCGYILLLHKAPDSLAQEALGHLHRGNFRDQTQRCLTHKTQQKQSQNKSRDKHCHRNVSEEWSHPSLMLMCVKLCFMF